MKILQMARLPLCAAAGAMMLWGLAVARETAPAPRPFDIQAQPVGDALNEFASQSGYQVLFLSKLGKDVKTAGVQGTLPPEQALQKLLEGSGLKYEFINERTVTIRADRIAEAA